MTRRMAASPADQRRDALLEFAGTLLVFGVALVALWWGLA